MMKFTYGDQILQWEKFSPIIISDNIPLNFQLTWQKLSCLPLETKLFLEFVVFSHDKKEAIEVGCAAFPLFNENGYLTTGSQSTNIWPFIKPDLRISGCIGCYQKGYGKTKAEYSQILVQFPKFNSKVRWSLRHS